MLKILLLFIALLSVLSSYSQVQISQAVIIFANKDSISAEIQNEQLKNIQMRIQYRQTGSDNFVTGLPGQVKSVRFTDGRLFETVKTDSVSFLLLCLVEGFYNLYKFERNGLITYYIRHSQDTPTHLVETFTDKYVQEDGQFHRISNFEYVHQLNTAMADNARITKEINETKFREDELVAIVKKYNEFKGNKHPSTAIAKKKYSKISTGILIHEFPFLPNFHLPGLGMNFYIYRNRPYQRFGLKTYVFFNIGDYKKGDRYNLLIGIPIALSYSYFERGRIRLDLLGGVSPFLDIDYHTSYGHRVTYTYVYPLPYLGTGIDYKIKQSALRLEISFFSRSFIFAYIF